MINPNAYYTVQAWMVNDLGLRGNELALYAIIYGFSQDGRSEFTGSITYVMEWLNCSRQTAVTTLANLVDKKLVAKMVPGDGINANAYRVLPVPAKGSQEIRPVVVKNLDGGSQEIRPGVVKNLDVGSQKIRPNNNIYNNYNNNSLNNKSIYSAPAQEAPAAPPPPAEKKGKDKPVKHKHGEYNNVLLTDEEYKKLQQEFPHDLEQRIDRLSEYIASTGKSYKSHYATIKAWARRDSGSQGQHRPAAPGRRAAGPVGPNGIAIDPTKNDLDGMFY